MSDFLNKAFSMLEKISDPTKAGKTLLGLNIFAMVLAAASNTFAIAQDKNTPAEDKKFLIPAGVATGIANIGAYFAITQRIIKGLEKGTDKIVKNMEQKGTLNNNALQYVNKTIEKAGKGLFKKSPEYISDMKNYLLKDGAPTANAISEYKDVIKGCGSVLGAFIGVIIGCGILTPIFRDVSAYFVKKHMEKKNPKLKDIPYRPYFDPSHIKLGYTNTKQPLNINTYMAFTRSRNVIPNGSLKV